jgi:hypothetical protein
VLLLRSANRCLQAAKFSSPQILGKWLSGIDLVSLVQRRGDV